MTMTDTEAKALALVNAAAQDRHYPIWQSFERSNGSVNEALCRAIEHEAATEARHAAELRELKERFSEACLAVKANYDGLAFPTLTPFILPAPDPLVEIAREMTLLDGVVRTDNQKAAIREGRAGNTASEDFYDRLRAALQARGGKIVWETGE